MFIGLIVAVFSLCGHAKVLHQEPELPEEWKLDGQLRSLTFRLALKQRGVQELHRIAKSVSDPSDSMYGKYLTQDELDALLAPSEAAVNTVVQWAANGSCLVHTLREVVTITCPVASAESLLETTCRALRNVKTKQHAVRCSGFSLPDDVHAVTQAVYGLHGLPMPLRTKHVHERGPDSQQSPVKVTPAVIRSTYKVSDVKTSGSEQNRQAVAEFQDQTMSSKDLATFWKKYLPEQKPELGKVHKYIGDPGDGAGQTEANLDVQYIMGVAPGILTEFWYFHPMDFCGDLKNWTQMILADKNPPLVHSVSYGWQGNLSTLMGCKMENVKDVDLDFVKLAARGITIIFASGDSGAGYTAPSECGLSGKFQEGVGLSGTVAQSAVVTSAEECCGKMDHKKQKGFTFELESQDTCSEQTVLKGVAFVGEGLDPVPANSSDECCKQALANHQAAWSFDGEEKTCRYFFSVRARFLYPAAISGLGNLPGGGVCKLYSSITGQQPSKNATSKVAANEMPKLYASWPASSPWVTAVGATRFVNHKVGQPEMATDQFGSGGGFSFMFDAFDEQKGNIAEYFKGAPQLPPASSFPHGGRATPDVASLGEGFQVVMNGVPTSVGGTSASAPLFAGLVSLLNEARLAKQSPPMGFLNPWLYAHNDVFTDVTFGDNLRGRGPFREPYGFNCTKGWDPVTGLGTPLFDKMLSAATSPSMHGDADIVV